MRDLNYQLKQLCHRNRDGSFATQADRERLLNLCANDLAGQGFQHMSVDSLKPKHVAALLDKWKQDSSPTRIAHGSAVQTKIRMAYCGSTSQRVQICLGGALKRFKPLLMR